LPVMRPAASNPTVPEPTSTERDGPTGQFVGAGFAPLALRSYHERSGRVCWFSLGWFSLGWFSLGWFPFRPRSMRDHGLNPGTVQPATAHALGVAGSGLPRAGGAGKHRIACRRIAG